MPDFIKAINDLIQMDILSTIGLLLAVAFLGSKIFQRLGIPQVVGFIVIGALHGPSFLNLIPLELGQDLTFLSEIALGLIGFDIGSHLKLRELRKLGRSIAVILIFESFGAFALVSAGVFALTQSWQTAILFGAIASATAPAATVDVLAEFDASGPLTTSLLAVIGMDDALALLFFSIASTFVEAGQVQGGGVALIDVVWLPIFEIGGSILLGAGLGLLLDWILCRMKTLHDSMAISIGFVFIGVGLSQSLELSLIFTSMVMGAVLVNRNVQHARNIKFTIEQAGPVIYVLFFALVGAKLQIELLPSMGLLGVVYILLRSIGKIAGTRIGGRLGGAQPAVRDNLGMGLLTQGGVAIGLSLAASQRFGDLAVNGQSLGLLIVNVVTATTFIVEIIGPLFVKRAISRAGEIGKAKLGPDAWASEGSPE